MVTRKISDRGKCMSNSKITEVETLRQTYPEPKGSSLDKVLYELDHHCINFVSRSPFLVLGTVGDVSPKGDNPGFVRVLDSKKLLIPDRSGNNRLDSYQNILSQPTIAIIFFIPGINETLRIRGKGEITMDSKLLAPSALKKKVPESGLIVHVREAYLHCGKAIIRSKLWQSMDNLDDFSVRDMFADHVGRDRSEFKEYYDDAMEKTKIDEGHK